ncbi:MAG: hypothetical protein IJV07_02995 [Alphaproteobacteria bacterium]|nr:hypothetical protein [Alphaproteobacteria bacterium]
MKKIGLIFKKIFHVIVRIIETALAFVIVVGGLALGRLYLSPIEIKDFLPTLERHLLPPDSGLKLDAESVTLHAAFSREGLLHIAVKDLTLIQKNEKAALRLPEVDVFYHLGHILTLNYTPNNIRIQKAFLRLIIDKNGRVSLYSSDLETAEKAPPEKVATLPIDNTGTSVLELLIQQLLSLDGVSLTNAGILIDDRQKNQKLGLRHLNLEIERQPGLNHAFQATATAKIGDDTTQISAEAQLNKPSRKMSFDIEFDKLYLKNLARILPVLSKADLIVSAKVNGLFDFKQSCEDIVNCFKESQFQIKILEPGTLDLPEPLTNLYRIQSGTINGAVSNHLEQIKIAKSTAKLVNGPSATLELDVTGLDAFLKDGRLDHIKTVLKSELSSLPIDQVPSVWPVATGPDAHAWVKANITAGTVDKAFFTLNFTGDELVDLYGEIPVHGVKVRYLDEMTPVQDFAGTVKLYPDRVLITGNKGTLNQIKLKDATIDLTDLQNDISHAKIILSAEGPVRDAMDLIAEKPLEFPQMFGLDTTQTGGRATVDLDLSFPLIDDLETTDVKVMVKSKITDGRFPTIWDSYPLTKGDFDLSVTNKNLKLAGIGYLADIPVTLSWTEDFTAIKKNDIHSVYDISATVDWKQLGKQLPAIDPYTDGTFTVKGQIKESNTGKVTGQLHFDLTQSDLFLYPISTEKPTKAPLTADISLTNLKNDTSVTYTVKGAADIKSVNPIQISGQANFGDKTQITIKELIAPKTDLSGSLTLNNTDNIDIRLKGNSWNAVGFYQKPKGQSNSSAEISIPARLKLDVDLRRLILAEDSPITNLRIAGQKENNLWQSLSVNAVAGSPFNLSYQPKKQTLTAASSDFGELIRRIGITDQLLKGNLSLTAKQQKNGGFDGKINIKKLSLKDPGFLVQAATILGIVDGIRGQDLTFSEGQVPFVVEPQRALKIRLTDGYLSGTSLGITFEGDVSGAKIAIVGSVIPAYVINSLPGKIPLIGGLFRDSDGGGLIGAKYQINGSIFNPEVSFSALKSMAPGILGKLVK